MSSGLLISDAAKKVKVEAHVLRYWEEELGLPIKRNELGHRYYTEEDVIKFKEIKDLKERGLQLKAIRIVLKNGKLDMLGPVAGSGRAEKSGTIVEKPVREDEAGAKEDKPGQKVEASRAKEEKTGQRVEVSRAKEDKSGEGEAVSRIKEDRPEVVEYESGRKEKVVRMNEELPREKGVEERAGFREAKRDKAARNRDRYEAERAETVRDYKAEAGRDETVRGYRSEADRHETARDYRAEAGRDETVRGYRSEADRADTIREYRAESGRGETVRGYRSETERDESVSYRSEAERPEAVRGNYRYETENVEMYSEERPEQYSIMKKRERSLQSESSEEKAKRLQWLLQQLFRETLRENNEHLCREMKESMLKELDYQFRMQEEREEERDTKKIKRDEEHFRKIDELLRKKRKLLK